jgi:hypothetical protein
VVTDTPDPVEAGGTVSYEIECFNGGPNSSSEAVILDITLPMGVPMAWTDYLALDEDARNAVDDAFLEAANFQIDENIWDEDNSGIYMGDSFNNGCEGLLIQPQNLLLPGNTSGKFYFDAELPSVGGSYGVAYMKADGTMVEVNYGRGGCNSELFEDCGDGSPDTGFPCMGPPLTVAQAAPAPVALVPNEGCDATDFDGFPADHVALIMRGTCNFSVKAGNATAAGATGVLIANTDALGSVTPTGDSVMSMGCTDANCHSLFMSPSAFLSYNDGEALMAALNEGEVMAYLGVRETDPEFRTLGAYLWSNGGTELDSDNDRWYEKTTLGGVVVDPPPTADFTFTTDGLTATFTDASTDNPTSWMWDFGDNAGTSTEQNPMYTFAAAGTYDVMLTATNDFGSDSITKSVTVEAVGVAPVASFTYTVDGMTATFMDTSTGMPTSWMWDFGDAMGTSMEQNPMYTYAEAGTYTVMLTAANDFGSNTFSMDVTVDDGGPTLDNFYFVPAAAFAPGAAGSFFVTDLDINNGGAAMASYQFLWLPRDTDNATPAASDVFTLAAGAVARYSNVLSEVFDAPEGALGALAIISDSMDLYFMSRTFNQADTGTFGQGLPGMAMMDMIPENMRMRILFMTENDTYRSNLGVLNGTGMPITIMWERFLADGTSLGTGSADLPAWGNTQLNRVFNDVAPVEGAYVHVWTETPGGYFAAYGSVLDAMTSDPTTVMPQ